MAESKGINEFIQLWTARQREYLDDLKGPAGGTSGTDGVDGLSAYEVWESLDGNEGGTENDFILAITGEDGSDGLSAYTLWARAGNTGTYSEYIAQMTGDKGDTGDAGAKGDKGNTGAKGAKGDTGAKGDAGTGGGASTPKAYFQVENRQRFSTSGALESETSRVFGEGNGASLVAVSGNSFQFTYSGPTALFVLTLNSRALIQEPSSSPPSFFGGVNPTDTATPPLPNNSVETYPSFYEDNDNVVIPAAQNMTASQSRVVQLNNGDIVGARVYGVTVQGNTFCSLLAVQL